MHRLAIAIAKCAILPSEMLFVNRQWVKQCQRHYYKLSVVRQRATSEFISIVDKFFDCLNVQNLTQAKYKNHHTEVVMTGGLRFAYIALRSIITKLLQLRILIVAGREWERKVMMRSDIEEGIKEKTMKQGMESRWQVLFFQHDSMLLKLVCLYINS